MSYNPTLRQYLNAVSASRISIVSTPSDVSQTERPIPSAIPCFEFNLLHRHCKMGVNILQGTAKF